MDQVHESVAQQRGVRSNMNRVRSLESEILPFFVGQYPELIDDISRNRSEVQGLWGHQHLSRVGARERQEALHEPREPVDLLQHAADNIAVRAGIEGVLQCYLAHAAHRS